MLVIWSHEQDHTGPICSHSGAVALREAKRVSANDLESHGHWKRPWQECEMTLCKEMSLESDCQWYPIIICYHICMSDFIQLLLSPSELMRETIALCLWKSSSVPTCRNGKESTTVCCTETSWWNMKRRKPYSQSYVLKFKSSSK